MMIITIATIIIMIIIMTNTTTTMMMMVMVMKIMTLRAPQFQTVVQCLHCSTNYLSPAQPRGQDVAACQSSGVCHLQHAVCHVWRTDSSATMDTIRQPAFPPISISSSCLYASIDGVDQNVRNCRLRQQDVQ